MGNDTISNPDKNEMKKNQKIIETLKTIPFPSLVPLVFAISLLIACPKAEDCVSEMDGIQGNRLILAMCLTDPKGQSNKVGQDICLTGMIEQTIRLEEAHKNCKNFRPSLISR